jgi:hypothetical protein
MTIDIFLFAYHDHQAGERLTPLQSFRKDLASKLWEGADQ